MRQAVPNDEWKHQMFRLYANEFVEVLETRSVSPNFHSLFTDDTKPCDRLAVLDLGCGTGRLLRSLSKFATIVVGLDYSPELLAVAARVSRGLVNALLIRGDARALQDIFVEAEFDAIIRAYTSLGYFNREVERSILEQCAFITRPGGKILVDCFNKAWFKSGQAISRVTALETFTLEEQYEWDGGRNVVSSLWRYRRKSGEPIEIAFSLDGYGIEEVRDLLRETGWTVTTFLEDLVTCKRIEDPSNCERIVALGERA